MRFLKILLLTVLFTCVITQAFSQTFTTEKTDSGWVLLRDGEPFPIYGMVWSFTPIGEKYIYNLWGQSEEHIKKVIDIDFSLMRDIGVNVIRSFSTIPPKWVEYIHENYGIYTAINYLFGRYGISVENKWHPQTNYAMPATREELLRVTIETVETYKDVKGVMMFMLGNENNYGLEWQSNEVQDLPSEERHKAKAEYLYSIFGEAVTEAQKRTSLPISIVNGDVLYIDLVQKYIPNLDIFATNVYRGKRTYEPENEYSTPFFGKIEEILDKPVVFSEFGSDAFNAITKTEDQYHQAEFLLSQWNEIYEESAGKEGSNNAIGGFVFQWMDEWWKRGLDTRLDIHDTEGSWTNGGYGFDFISEQWDTFKNMNEEWLGILAQSTEYYPSYYGKINKRVPRAAYFMLGEVWKENMFDLSSAEVRDHFSTISIEGHLARSLELKDKTASSKPDLVSISTDLAGGLRLHWSDKDVEQAAAANLSYGQTAILRTTIRPLENLEAKLDLRFQYEAQDDVFYDSYEYLITKGDFATNNFANTYLLAAELYSSAFFFSSEVLDIEGLFHDGYLLPGHTDWIAEGDFFGLLPETFYKHETDVVLSKAPFGVEFTAHSYLEGLKIYLGPEIFNGARPSLMAKYYREFNTEAGAYRIGLLHEEEFALRVREVDRTTEPLARKSSLLFGVSTPLLFNTVVINTDFGVLLSGLEKTNTEYVSGYATTNGIPGTTKAGFGILDALAYKGRVSFDFATNPILSFWAEYVYAGLLAKSRAIASRDGSSIISNGSGNKQELTGGAALFYGDFNIMANVLWRNPLEDALNTSVSGSLITRDPINEYLTVNGNRSSLQLELLLNYDLTGATYFHDWDNDDKEDALFASSFGFHYTVYNGRTDALSFKDVNGATFVFPEGLKRVDNLFAAKLRVVSAFAPSQKLIFSGLAGTSQNTGDPSVDIQTSFSAKVTYFLYQFEISTWLDRNIWGPEDWHREFGLTIPWQYGFYLAYHFDKVSSLEPQQIMFLQLRFRNFGESNDAAKGAINPLGDIGDGMRFEVSLGYRFRF